ncbi:hypothetical protein SEPCBS119000_001191 [Sporothrix epigloea]|uniref:Uncharacterized protein n=1 Tax=Sporothrix epigloea TaxID=1892477 RepID=A0ABP0D9C8_9PEZI
MASNNDSTDGFSRNRRSSVTSAALSSIFRSNSTSSAATGTPVFSGSITSATMNQNRRRRLSVSTSAALGLSGANGGTNTMSAGPSGGIGPNSFTARRASMSTNSSASDSAFDENAIEDDDGPTGTIHSPTTPFARRMSFGAQAMRSLRGPAGTSPGGASTNGRQRSSLASSVATSAVAEGEAKQPHQQQQSPSHSSPRSPSTISSQPHVHLGSSFSLPKSLAANHTPTNTTTFHSFKVSSDRVFLPDARADQGYNWPEQLRSRAESSVTSGSRPSFSIASGLGSSPPRASVSGAIPGYTPTGGGVGNGGGVGMRHDRAKSVSEMPTPAAAQPRPAPQSHREARPKPDHFQERILKGDFYMD